MSGNSIADLAHRDTERHILAAVDESDNSRRAIMYLADFFSGNKDVFITVLSIIPEPSEDFFAAAGEREKWLHEKQAQMQAVHAAYRDILLGAGFADGQVGTRLLIKPCASIADAILEEQAKLRCCMLVVGRRGISHSEEFIFGSTSNRILHHAAHCAVLVVE